MSQIRRRKTLQLSAASALAAGTGGLAGILASGRAPAYAQTQTMHWLRWADFVPASDQLLKGDIAKACEKDLGMKLTVETINANDIQARITAAIQSGSGPDIFMTLNNWPQLYYQSCVDRETWRHGRVQPKQPSLSDLCAGRHGGWPRRALLSLVYAERDRHDAAPVMSVASNAGWLHQVANRSCHCDACYDGPAPVRGRSCFSRRGMPSGSRP